MIGSHFNVTLKIIYNQIQQTPALLWHSHLREFSESSCCTCLVSVPRTVCLVLCCCIVGVCFTLHWRVAHVPFKCLVCNSEVISQSAFQS